MKALFVLIRLPIFCVIEIALLIGLALHIALALVTLLVVPILWVTLWLPFIVITGALSNDTVEVKSTIRGDIASYFSLGHGAGRGAFRRHISRLRSAAAWLCQPEKFA